MTWVLILIRLSTVETWMPPLSYNNIEQCNEWGNWWVKGQPDIAFFCVDRQRQPDGRGW